MVAEKNPQKPTQRDRRKQRRHCSGSIHRQYSHHGKGQVRVDGARCDDAPVGPSERTKHANVGSRVHELPRRCRSVRRRGYPYGRAKRAELASRVVAPRGNEEHDVLEGERAGAGS